ncbi:MAG TPA: hemerythrin domain-containing protein, partial [Bacteroidia bacterium]|nr:hemerythrin domain-containing protein [Bacteroidia bacterium]
KRMVEAKNNKESVQQSSFGSVKGPINMMEIEHESAGKNMSEIRTLSNDFTLPEDACASYSLLFRLLEEFEEDLHTHVHLENNILFPKALALEKELVTK